MRDRISADLRIRYLTVDELASGDGSTRDLPQADLLRITDPPAERWDDLRKKGFVIRPNRLVWLVDVHRNADAYLASLPRQERRAIRQSYRAVRDSSVRLEVLDPLDATFVENFHALYLRQLATMRAPHDYVAKRLREISTEEGYFAVAGYLEHTLVTACIGHASTEPARLRYAATEPSLRSIGLSRALYITAFEHLRQRRRYRVSLGKEPNLYGHLTDVGLASFKLRLGGVPVPAADVYPGSSLFEAEHILSQGVLRDPSLSFVLAASPTSRPLDARLYSNEPMLHRSSLPLVSGARLGEEALPPATVGP